MLFASDTIPTGPIPEPTFDLNLARKVVKEAKVSDRATDLFPSVKKAMETLMKRVKRGRFVLLPESAGTTGHNSGGDPSLWKQYLAELMR